MPSVFTVLAAIPWAQVVESAPKIAQGAARLWESVKNRRQAQAAGEDVQTTAPGEPIDLASLLARTQALQAQVQTLQDEMRASAEVVKQLAEQNALLIQRMEAMHQRIKRLALLGGAALVALALTMAYQWFA